MYDSRHSYREKLLCKYYDLTWIQIKIKILNVMDNNYKMDYDTHL